MSMKNDICGDHIKYSAMISAYLDGELSQEDEKALDEHLSGCDECRDRLDVMRQVREVMGASAITPPEELHASVMEKIHAENMFLRKKRAARYIAATAAVLVLVVGLTAAPYIFVATNSDKSAEPGVEINDADCAFGADANGNYADVMDNPNSVPDSAPTEGADAPEDLTQSVGDTVPAGSPEQEPSQNPGGVSPGNPSASGSSGTDIIGMCEEIFEKYGGGYDGGYVIYFDGGDTDTLRELAKAFGADLDGKALVLPYSQEAEEKIIMSLAEYGYCDTRHVGSEPGEQCIIVFVR